MKFLRDNGFNVLTMNQLGYDIMNNVFYLNNIPTFSTTTAVQTTITNPSE